ncbi:hypothetical protein NC652_002855 [Populus alba x Populus x berolinensis]|nr:hypothetical protein NC652_002855 [Populus alba x Populus x berolinensis]
MEGSLFLNLEGGTPRTQFLQTIPWCSRKLVLTGGNISPMSGTPALEMKGNCLLLLTNTKTLSRLVMVHIPWSLVNAYGSLHGRA